MKRLVWSPELSMSERIEKRPLPVIVAERVEAAISEGVWVDELPGRRVLARHFEVSVKSCVGALEILLEKGLIESAGKGKPFLIVKGKAGRVKSEKSMNLLLLHQSNVSITHDDEDLLRGLQSAWLAGGGMVHRVPVDFGYHKRARNLLGSLVRRYGADAVLLYAPPYSWAEAASEVLPVFQVGGLLERRLGISYYATEVLELIPQVLEYLFSRGHRRIMIPWEDEGVQRPTLQAMERAYGDLDEGGEMEDVRVLREFCPLMACSTPEAASVFWREQLARLEPTAVVVEGDRGLLSLYGFCYRAGLKIPADLSVISLSANPVLNWMYPRPSMMSFPNERVVGEFKKWMGSGCKAMGIHLLPLTLIEGESVRSVC